MSPRLSLDVRRGRDDLDDRLQAIRGRPLNYDPADAGGEGWHRDDYRQPLPPEAPFARLSLNLEALVAADAILLVVTGADKRRLLEGVIAGQSQHLPVAQLLRAAKCPATIYWSE